MADDMPEAEAALSTPALKLTTTKPSSPVQKTNSNTHNAVDGSATDEMSHTLGSIKRIRSLDVDDQEATSNSSSPKRPRLAEEGEETTTNCKSPNINNKDGNSDELEPSKNNKDVNSKKEHLTSNGALDDSKNRGESPVNCSKPNSEGSIDRANDADVSSKAESEKDEDSPNGPSTKVDETPKNGVPSEHINVAGQSIAASLSKDHNGPLESNLKSTLSKDVESDNERTGSSSVEKPGDKLCDSNAKDSCSGDKVIPKDDQEEERMEVDGEDVAATQDSDKTVAPSSTANGEDTEASKSKENGVETTSDAVSSSSKDVAKDGDVESKNATKESADKGESNEDSVNKKDNSDAGSDKSEPNKDGIKKDAETAMDTSEKDDNAGKKAKDKAGDDIIVLSDDSVPEVKQASQSATDGDDTSRTPSPIPEPTDPLDNLTDEQLKSRDTIIQRLNEDLRNEEAKLLLLKKLRQSQQQPAPTEPKEDPNNVVDTSKIFGRNQHTTLPPPLVPGPGQLKPQLSNQASQLAQQQRLQMPQLIRGGNLQQGQQVGHHGNMQGGPPPLVLARAQQHSLNTLQQVQQQQQMNRNQMIRMISTNHITQTSNTLSNAQHGRVSSTNSAQQETQSAASRQAAAKLALRKQLEKTLLQIPPPKPPPPELHFLPSAANNEFIILVGLEEVVNTILDLEKRDKSKKDPKYLAPFKCAQCKTDFTTIWKQGSKQGIMCENCIVSNQKKALKAEHTNRLKTAFVKALQQEQEIEQRMQQSHTAAAQAAAAAGSLNIPKVNKVKVPLSHGHQVHHGIQVIQQQQQHQQQQHSRQRVLNPAPAQRTMQPVTYAYIPQVSGVNIAGIQMIPKQQFVAGHHGIVTASDRQREYLLDMISNKSGSNISGWKR